VTLPTVANGTLKRPQNAGNVKSLKKPDPKPEPGGLRQMPNSYWRLKGCSRCSGDLFTDQDSEGWYQQCLQCGYRKELTSTVPVPPLSRGSYLKKERREIKL